MEDGISFFVVRGNDRQPLPLGDGAPLSGRHNIIREDENVSFLLRSNEELTNPLMWLQDSVFEISSRNRVSGTYDYYWEAVSPKHPFFRNYFGASQIIIELAQPPLRPRLVYAEVEVVATKLNAEQAEYLLHYLESKMSDIVRSCFSRTHQRAEEGGTSSTDALVLLQKVKQQMDVLTENVPMFRNRKRYRLVPKPMLVDIASAPSLSENSVAWVLAHLDLLSPSVIASPSSINIHNKLYEVQKVETDLLHEDTDVYENQAVLGYLEDVEATLTRVENMFRAALDEVETGLTAQDIPDGYVSVADIQKRYGRKYFYRLLDLCAEVQEVCQQCKKFWQSHLPVKRSLKGMPKITPGFLASAHYRNVFNLIVDWYRTGNNINLTGERYLLGLRTLPKLYEFFCLYRIIQSLENKGFTVIETSRRDQFEMFEKNTLPCDCYTLMNTAGMQLKLFYILDIRTVGQSEDDWVDVVHRSKGPHSQYTPDFFVEIVSEAGKKTCIILDAKYTKPRQAMRTLGEDYDYADELTKLTMKYVHGINIKRGGTSPVSALFILHPKAYDNQQPDGFRLFQSDRYDIFSRSPALPALGAIEVTPDGNSELDTSNGNHWLGRVLDQTLKISQMIA